MVGWKRISGRGGGTRYGHKCSVDENNKGVTGGTGYELVARLDGRGWREQI